MQRAIKTLIDCKCNITEVSQDRDLPDILNHFDEQLRVRAKKTWGGTDTH